MSDDLAALLAAERQKTRRLRLALAGVVGLLLLLGGALVWQTVERRAERDRAAAREAEARRRVQELIDQADQVLGEARASEVEDLLRAAEVKRKLNAFVEPREPAPPDVAPPPRSVGP